VDLELEQKAKKLIEKYRLINPGDRILVGFSGGSDSSALLYFLAKEFGRENIYAAHLNHEIRGNDACSDEKFVVETCGRYDVKIFTERKNIPELAKIQKKSVEEAGRDARYDFFYRVCGEIGGNLKIATAHNAPDNTESVLINLSRGTGLTGLCGIAPVNHNIIRPLLSCEKHEILEYCLENNINFIEDKSNSDESYMRNFIRHSVAAKIKERYAGMDGNIIRMSEIMRDTDDFMNMQAENILKDYDYKENGLPVSVFAAQHKALRRLIIIKMCEDAGGSLYFSLAEELDNALLENKLVRQDLPGNTAAEVKDGKFRIYKEEKDYRIYRKENKSKKYKNI
jgi:tRNA(Ile)-lysidine synthase